MQQSADLFNKAVQEIRKLIEWLTQKCSNYLITKHETEIIKTNG